MIIKIGEKILSDWEWNEYSNWVRRVENEEFHNWISLFINYPIQNLIIDHGIINKNYDGYSWITGFSGCMTYLEEPYIMVHGFKKYSYNELDRAREDFDLFLIKTSKLLSFI